MPSRLHIGFEALKVFSFSFFGINILPIARNIHLTGFKLSDYMKILQDALDLLMPKPEKAVIKKETPTLRYPGGMKVGLTAFGYPITHRIEDAVTEFKYFIEKNSKIRLDLYFIQTDNLPHEEIPRYNVPGIYYMVTPQSLSPASRAKMPAGMKTEIVVYDTMDRVNCYGGLQWGYSVPFICIPYSKSLTWDPGWQTSLAPALVHEFTHALFTMLGLRGFKSLPNIDKANEYGFSDQNDPGWHNFRKHCLGLITQEMAEALMKA